MTRNACPLCGRATVPWRSKWRVRMVPDDPTVKEPFDIPAVEVRNCSVCHFLELTEVTEP